VDPRSELLWQIERCVISGCVADKPTTVFFSWQSDTPSSRNRQFIEDSLREAIETIATDPKLELADRPITLDKDTAGVAGSPPIVQTIFDKIDRCAAFVADMTFVGKSLPELADKRDRLIPNPNVLVEHGYALSRRTFSRVISVMNTAYGACNEATLPFDLRHMRWPLTYKLSKDEPKEPVKKAFVKDLTVALRSILLLGDDLSTDDIFSAIQAFEAAVSEGKTNTGYLAEKAFGKIENELTQHRITQKDDKPFDETLIESLKN
jgi:hypothetical protein